MSVAPLFRARAYAKVNLGLKILGLRSDGFHELRTIYQTISLADGVEVALARGRGIGLTVEGDAPGGPANLAFRAAELFAESFRLAGRIEIRLTKNIPLGAGLGGGSSDAAAVLRLLGKHLKAQPSPAQLLALAAHLGSDVPPFLIGGTVLGVGRGEEVYPLPDLGSWYCVVAMPRAGAGAAIATPEAFQRWDKKHPGLTPAAASATMVEFCSLVQQVLPAFRYERNRGAAKIASPKVHAGIENDFQPEVFSLSPDFSRIHQQLRRARAGWVSLTGSGAAQYGLFSRRDAATSTAVMLGNRYRSWLTRFVGRRMASNV